MFFTKSLISKRADAFYKAYQSLIDALPDSDEGKEVPMISKSYIESEMLALFTFTEPKAFRQNKSRRQLMRTHNDRIVSGKPTHIEQRFLIDTTLGFQLAKHHKCENGGLNEWVENLSAHLFLAYQSYGFAGMEEEAESLHGGVDTLASLPSDALSDGVLYAGDIKTFYREAIALNLDELNRGSVWTSSSTDANQIKEALVGRGIDAERIHIHTEDSLAKQKVFCPDTTRHYSFSSLLHMATDDSLRGMSCEMKEAYEDALVALFSYNTHVEKLNGGNFISYDQISLPKLIQIRDSIAPQCDDDTDFSNHYKRYANSAIEGLSAVFGGEIGVDVEATTSAMEHFNQTLGEARQCCNMLESIMLLTESCVEFPSVLSVKDFLLPDGEHHIFAGKRLSALFTIFVKEFSISSFHSPEVSPNASLKACFVEQTSWLVCGFLVLPSSCRRYPAAMNVFLSEDAMKAELIYEELASANANSLYKVIGKPFGQDFLTNYFMRHLCLGQYAKKPVNPKESLFFSRDDIIHYSGVAIVG